MMTLEEIQERSAFGLMQLLDIVFTEAGEEYLVAEMPVSEKVLQPAGVTHGGALVTLAESVGSAASYLLVDPEDRLVLGNTLYSQHIAPATEGRLIAKAELVSAGAWKHIWDVKIRDEKGRLVSMSRITNSIKERRDRK